MLQVSFFSEPKQGKGPLGKVIAIIVILLLIFIFFHFENGQLPILRSSILIILYDLAMASKRA